MWRITDTKAFARERSRRRKRSPSAERQHKGIRTIPQLQESITDAKTQIAAFEADRSRADNARRRAHTPEEVQAAKDTRRAITEKLRPPLDRNASAIAVVDSNLHREHILPSEKAFAYRLKMDALNHRGVTCGQVGHKSRDDISDTESGRTIQRYIRLTNLIPELLAKMDEGQIALSVGVELSYLPEELQQAVAEAVEYCDCTPSYAQAVRMHRERFLSREGVFRIMGEEKANQREKVSFRVGDLRKYFPASYSAREMQAAILRLVQEEYGRQQRRRDRER